MSTQKRERRRRPKSLERAGGWDRTGSTHIARFVQVVAGGETALLWSMIWSAWAWMATKFLRKDQTTRHCVRLESFPAELAVSPPSRARGRLVRQLAARGTPASPGHPAIHLPSGTAFSLLTLPQAPAYCCRAERQDGKRDLYILNAA
jgi:hypothetical protein